LCEDLEPFLKSLAEEIREMQEDTVKLEKDLENNYKIVDNKEIIPPVTSGGNEPILEGYLFKRTSNAFKTWNRRWFCLRDNQLVYRKRTGEEESTMEEDLRLCTIKHVVDGDRRFCFEIVSPSKNHILQADSKDMLDTWISAVQKGIGIALQRHHSGNYAHVA
ncbi:Pleckstrin homology domain containing protein, partial [Oryctes borbonicus]